MAWTPGRAIEALLLSLADLVVPLAIFGPWIFPRRHLFPISHLLLPLLLWACLRFGLRGATWSILLTAIAAVSGRLLTYGAFTTGSSGIAILLLQSFVMVVAVTGLFLSAVLAERDRKQAALTESETRLRAIVEHTDELIYIKDLEGRYLFVNPAHARVLSQAPGELVGHRLQEFVPEERGQRIREHDRAVLESGCLMTFEEAGMGPDGREHVFLATKYPYRAPDGRILGIIGVARDITERKKAADAIAKQTAELAKAKELDRLKSSFVDSVTHELRTPLTSIKGYAEFLEDQVGGSLSRDQAEFVQQIQRGAQRLEHLVDDLLDFARMEAGTFRLRLADVDMGARIREVAESLRPQANEARLRLEIDLPKTPLHVVADAQRIGQVLLNLLNNAVKFTPEGGTIRVTARQEGDDFYCAVSDTGVGIAAEEQAKLFQRFTQLSEGVRKVEGTGLGLSISKALVEAHCGTIGVRSESGRGSTFWFRLPLRPGCELGVSAAAAPDA